MRVWWKGRRMDTHWNDLSWVFSLDLSIVSEAITSFHSKNVKLFTLELKHVILFVSMMTKCSSYCSCCNWQSPNLFSRNSLSCFPSSENYNNVFTLSISFLLRERYILKKQSFQRKKNHLKGCSCNRLFILKDSGKCEWSVVIVIRNELMNE